MTKLKYQLIYGFSVTLFLIKKCKNITMKIQDQNVFSLPKINFQNNFQNMFKQIKQLNKFKQLKKQLNKYQINLTPLRAYYGAEKRKIESSKRFGVARGDFRVKKWRFLRPTSFSGRLIYTPTHGIHNIDTETVKADGNHDNTAIS